MSTMVPERDMTPEEFQGWYARLGLKQVDLAEKLDVDQSQISRWLNGKSAPPGYLWRALEHLEAEMQRRRKRQRRHTGAGGGR
jgi:predicted transcriptional regulator